MCGFAQTVYFARAKALHSAFAHTLQIWNGSLFSLSLATNVTVTLLISLRVWYALTTYPSRSESPRLTCTGLSCRYMLRLGGSRTAFRYWRILLIIIESGMVYSVALICEITLYFLKSNAFYIVYDPIAQLTVRTPSLIPSALHSKEPMAFGIHADICHDTQAITPTLIIILAALQLTTNDVHSRLTRSKNANTQVIRFNPPSQQTASTELDTMRFADNNAIPGPKDTFASADYVVDYEKATPGVRVHAM